MSKQNTIPHPSHNVLVSDAEPDETTSIVKPVAATIICLACGKGFSAKPSAASKRKFCNWSCLNQVRYRAMLTCLLCAAKFKVQSSRKDTAKYCSKHCFDTVQRASLRTWQCERCGGEFLRPDRFGRRQFRFCNKSCLSHWRWAQAAIRSRAEHSLKKASQDPVRRAASSARMKACNPMENPLTREKMRRSLQGRTFLARGGNGQPTIPQMLLADALGLPMEYVINTAPVAGRFPSLPHCYKVDIGDPQTRVAIEVDGLSHNLRKWKFLDRRKTEILNALGWQVIRFKNEEVLSDLRGVVERVHCALGTSSPPAEAA